MCHLSVSTCVFYQCPVCVLLYPVSLQSPFSHHPDPPMDSSQCWECWLQGALVLASLKSFFFTEWIPHRTCGSHTGWQDLRVYCLVCAVCRAAVLRSFFFFRHIIYRKNLGYMKQWTLHFSQSPLTKSIYGVKWQGQS